MATVSLCDACGELRPKKVRTMDLCQRCLNGAGLWGIKYLAEVWYTHNRHGNRDDLRALPGWGDDNTKRFGSWQISEGNSVPEYPPVPGEDCSCGRSGYVVPLKRGAYCNVCLGGVPLCDCEEPSFHPDPDAWDDSCTSCNKHILKTCSCLEWGNEQVDKEGVCQTCHNLIAPSDRNSAASRDP
jgi:hypothetical protein